MSMTVASRLLAKHLEVLTEPQRIFVRCKLEGMSTTASAVAAGWSPKNATNMMKSPAVQEAIQKGLELFATEVLFTRREAHKMYMEAHANAATSTEQVLAVNALVKLHGIAAPEVKEIHQHIKGEMVHREVGELTDTQLLELAKLPQAQLPHILEGEYDEVEETDSSGAGGRSESGEGSAEESAEPPTDEGEAEAGEQKTARKAKG